MVVPTVGGTERVDGRHIMQVAEMVATTVGGTGGCKPGQGGSVRPHLPASTDSSVIQTLPGDSCCNYRG